MTTREIATQLRRETTEAQSLFDNQIFDLIVVRCHRKAKIGDKECDVGIDTQLSDGVKSLLKEAGLTLSEQKIDDTCGAKHVWVNKVSWM
jgi:hypothetical protein